MALRPCRECGKEVSTEAKACPHCGVKNPVKAGLSAGMGCLVVVALVVGAGFVASLSEGGGSPQAPITTTRPTPVLPRLSLTVDECGRESGTTWTRGSVKNDGEITVQFVQVRLTWADASGGTVDTGSTYAVGNESLRPGESSTFEYYTDHPAARSCQASVLDYNVVR